MGRGRNGGEGVGRFSRRDQSRESTKYDREEGEKGRLPRSCKRRAIKLPSADRTAFARSVDLKL